MKGATVKRPAAAASWRRRSSAGFPAWELKGEMTARDRTKRTIQIRVRSEFLESKENHEKHRREKNHFNEAAFDPKYKKGPHEWKEKGNKLH